MFDVGYSELLLIAIVTLLVVGPKELPNLLRKVGKWTAQARGMARHFRSGFDTMVREAEIDEMNRQWAAQNEAIMAGSKSYTPDPERDADLEAIADLPPPPASEPEAPPAKPKRTRAKKPPAVPPAP
ncbi:Sec-independent protein translocase protein TatB [Sphingoaurantiacus capsulatus]|uniref:Sec-independent protein translocase protein TatB n=1 Tax=Sphingoaurantiacus capsulatus TaxID=1771310 RepID=A0ABV7XAW8_9SPHN